MGLHASRELERQLLAGPYHPAYRELCQSHIYLERAREALSRLELPKGAPRRAELWAASLSQLIGQHRANLLALSQEGWELSFQEDRSLPAYLVRAAGG